MKTIITTAVCLFTIALFAQTNTTGEKYALKYNLNDNGSRYFQITFLNQTWLRLNQSNSATLVNGKAMDNTFDIGLRRTRIQLFGQITPRVFLYFQFGQNNFNAVYNNAGNRKISPFFHDAVCEYRLTKNNELKIGAGLTIANGLSRFSQPSIGTIMTMDVPVFAQATVEQTDQFSRKLSIYARGQIGRLDYRLSLSDPFPVTTLGTPPPAINKNSNYAQIGRMKQYQSYLFWQFFDKEPHNTPYMTGSYLGKKKVLSVGGGFIYQPKAMWNLENTTDTVYHNMLLWSAEAFFELPFNSEKNNALSAYAGYFNTYYGPNYLRYNGIMNPATSTSATTNIGGAGPTFGNAFPMFGTGQVFYGQLGYLFRNDLFGEEFGTLQPYVSVMIADYERLNGKKMDVYNAGLNWLIKGHNAKISLDYQLRPTYSVAPDGNTIKKGQYRSAAVMQFQISI